MTFTPAPKPSPRVSLSDKAKRVTRQVRLARVNAKRKKSEFARAYGSKERVEWVKAQACVMCSHLEVATVQPCHNAHTVSGGKGRKADANTIIPLCPEHHRQYDDYIEPFDRYGVRDFFRAKADDTERRWQAFQELNRTTND